MSAGETGERDPTDLFGGLSDDESSDKEASLDTEENTASPEGVGAAGGFLGQVAAAGVAKPPTATDGKLPTGEPPSNTAGNDNADDGKDPGAAGVGGVAPEAGNGADSSAGARATGAEAEEKDAAAGAAGSGGGSRPRKTLPRMDPEEALRAFAESVGMPVDRMWRGVTEMWGGGVEIDWGFKGLEGTLPVGDMHMPYLMRLNLRGNRELKGEARRLGVTDVKFTDCVCELTRFSLSVCIHTLSTCSHVPPSSFFLRR